MPNQIDDPANEYTFGKDFNYGLWLPNTELTLVNVPWDNNYRDIVKFDNKAAVNTYINSLPKKTISNVSYIKPNMPITLDIPFNEVYGYNYIRATNPNQPIPGDITKEFYYFILDAVYVAPNATKLVLQLDIWQTFGYDVTFGNSYIERGHIGMANANRFSGYGRDYLTIPEGIDIGSEYQYVATRQELVMTGDFYYKSGIATGATSQASARSSKMHILVVSTVNLATNPGTVAAPVLVTAKGSLFQGLPSGAELYLFKSGNSFVNFISQHADKPWVTQGIISVTGIPNIYRYTTTTRIRFENPAVGPLYGGYEFNGTDSDNEVYDNLLMPIMYTMFKDWRTELRSVIPERYRHLDKLMVYPYLTIEMTTFTGTPIIIKPESWTDDDATIVERPNIFPPNQRVVFTPYRYNAHPNSIPLGITGIPDDKGEELEAYDGVNTRWRATEDEYGETLTGPGGDDQGDYLDVATMIANFPTFPVVNNMAIGYLASNANSIGWQYQDAGWQQNRALFSASTQFAQGSAANSAFGTQADLQRQSNSMQNNINNNLLGQQAYNSAVMTGYQGASGVVGNFGAANPGAMLTSIPNSAVNIAKTYFDLGNSQSANNATTALRNNLNLASTGVQQGLNSFINDTNKNLADYSAHGDYHNQIAGINAKVQDAALIQPSMSGQYGGDTFNIVGNNLGINLRWKMIDPANIRVIGEYWLRYGYAVRKFAIIPPTLMVMSKFTYWKLLETYVSSSTIPESFKQIIRGIFEKGVTVWKTPSDIGTIDIADNEPLDGIVL